MNVQHTQQIQHIRHAKQYMQTESSAVSRPRRRGGMSVFAAAGAVAFITVGASTAPAMGSHPSEEGRTVVTNAAKPAQPADTVSSPCFGIRTPDRWATDVGAAPRCPHTYGASDTAFAITVDGAPASPAPVSADRYEHQIASAAAVDTPEQHWRDCFTRYGSFRAWEQVQVGTPACS